MGQRREPRKDINVPVRIFGTDSAGKAFSENVSTINVSHEGVLLAGVRAELKLGEVIGLTYGSNKVRFAVKWVSQPNSAQEHRVGLLNVTTDKPLWDFPLPARGMDEFGRHTTGAERRQSPRMKCINSVELQPDGESSPIWGKAVELGMGGCFVEMPIPLRQGVKLKMALWIQETKLWMRAKVVSSRPGFGIGLQFTEIADADKAVLKDFLRSITRIGTPKF